MTLFFRISSPKVSFLIDTIAANIEFPKFNFFCRDNIKKDDSQDYTPDGARGQVEVGAGVGAMPEDRARHISWFRVQDVDGRGH
jgi:hypothetical protein